MTALPTPPPDRPPTATTEPMLDATCDRIVAALTRRLADAARHIESMTVETGHDFLVSVLHPELAEPPVRR